MLILKIAIVFVLITATRALAVMWGVEWFLTPLGVPAVGPLHALGISTFVGMLTASSTPSDYEHPPLKVVSYGLAANLVALGFMSVWQLGGLKSPLTHPIQHCGADRRGPQSPSSQRLRQHPIAVLLNSQGQ